MIALLFALLTAAMLLALIRQMLLAHVVFGMSVVLGAYWLKFHATSQLTINL